jgi:hypothetical protein
LAHLYSNKNILHFKLHVWRRSGEGVVLFSQMQVEGSHKHMEKQKRKKEKEN